MGVFSRRQPSAYSPSSIELNEQWFLNWAFQIRDKVGEEQFLRINDSASQENALATIWAKASAVIDHDCCSYIQRYCSAAAYRDYQAYVKSDDLTPWGLIYIVISLNPDQREKWQMFVVNDMKQKLGRFAEILTDPDVGR